MHPFTFLPAIHKGSNLYTSLPTPLIFPLFNYDPSKVLTFISLRTWWPSFHVLLAICISPLEKCLFKSFDHYLKFYNFGKIQITLKFTVLTILSIQFNGVKYIYIAVQLISRTFHLVKWKLCPLTNCPFTLHPAPGNHHSTFY